MRDFVSEIIGQSKLVQINKTAIKIWINKIAIKMCSNKKFCSLYFWDAVGSLNSRTNSKC